MISGRVGLVIVVSLFLGCGPSNGGRTDGGSGGAGGLGGKIGGTGGSGAGGASDGGTDRGDAGSGGKEGTGGVTGTGGSGAGGHGTGGASDGGAADRVDAGIGGMTGTGGVSGSGGIMGTGGGAPHLFLYGPTVSSRGSGTLDVFAADPTGIVYQKTLSGGTWGAWTAVNSGLVTSDMDATSWNGSRIDLFALGDTSQFVQATFAGSWGNWMDLASSEQSYVGPSVSSPSDGRLWLFATSQDNKLLASNFNIASAGAWSPWTNLGGETGYSPDATSRPNVTWVAVINATTNLIQVSKLSGTTWSPFVELPNLPSAVGRIPFSSAPCITSWSDTRVDVFARGGLDNNVWHNYSTDGGATWQLPDWEGLGGNLTSDPDCVAWASGRLDVVIRGGNDEIQHRGYDGTWAAWEDLGTY